MSTRRKKRPERIERTGGGRDAVAPRLPPNRPAAPLGVTPLPCIDCGAIVVGDCSLPMTICFVRVCPVCSWQGVEVDGRLVEY